MKNWMIGPVVVLVLSSLVVACSTPADPIEFSEHPEGWNSEASDNFHGRFVLEGAGKADNCISCHGEDFGVLPGNAQRTCFDCHASFPHPDGFADIESDNFHTVTVAEVNWKIDTCQTCHGGDYGGENVASKNCLTCHTDDDGPEACNTCHGDAAGAAPPEDLSGETSTSAAGVGAHQAHLISSGITDILTPACSHCHAEPSSLITDGHLDDGPVMAELLFSDFATSNGSLSTAYDPATQTCSNVYCHGSFEFLKAESMSQFAYTEDSIRGNDLVIGWTDVGTGAAACGSCHALPPIGHAPITACANCHGSVVDADNNIIDPSKHINGEINTF